MLPTPTAVAELFEALLGKQVVAKAIAPWTPTPRSKIVVVTYVRRNGAVGAVYIWELAIANSAGAALTAIPPSVAEQGTRRERVEGAVLDNFGEVCNVASQIVASSIGDHVRFGMLEVTTLSATAKTRSECVEQPSARLDLELTIAGYASGKLAVLVC